MVAVVAVVVPVQHVDGNTTVDGPTHTRLTRLGIPCAIRNLNFFQP